MTAFEQSILLIRCLFHLATFAILLSYRDPNARPKPGVACIAIVLTFVSGALGMRAFFAAWHMQYMSASQMADNVLWLILSAVLFSLVAVSRGNVARMLPN